VTTGVIDQGVIGAAADSECDEVIARNAGQQLGWHITGFTGTTDGYLAQVINYT
jgi:hypothetical protein